MKNVPEKILQIVCFLLILLWVYAAVSKLIDFNSFKVQLQRQVLPPQLKILLIYLLPPAEILTAILLLSEQSQKAGLYISFIMLFAFTIYIGLAISNAFGKVPCSCGGVLTHLGWKNHLIFNIFFLLLTASGIYIAHREGRVKHSE
jgi:putative oxidoreductase